MEKRFSCIDCGAMSCDKCNHAHPSFCVSKGLDQEIIDESLKEYKKKKNQKVMQASAETEFEYYCQATRVEETMLWAKKLGAKKIGIASCVGLLKESRTLAAILRKNGFEVYGIGCKAGEVPKTTVGIDEKCNAIGVNMCNPILQARVLNREKTDINIVMGLCVGHDSLFYKYSKALTTTLVTKDRVLGHNPVAALNCAHSYYMDKLENCISRYAQDKQT